MRLTVMIWQRLLYGDRIYRLEAEFCFKDQTIHVVTSDVLRLEISRGDHTYAWELFSDDNAIQHPICISALFPYFAPCIRASELNFLKCAHALEADVNHG